MFEEYRRAAGFPHEHIKAFQAVCNIYRVVIASRELNPLCTDLLLEGYAAKGFHIKAKTCDERFPLAAGFVPYVAQLTKRTQPIEKQSSAVAHAISYGAGTVELVISDDRLRKLRDNGLIALKPLTHEMQEAVTVKADSGSSVFRFAVTRDRASNRWQVWWTGPTQSQWTRLKVLTNPERKSHYKDAVCGDYDLWGVFPHQSANDLGIRDRPAQVPATLMKGTSPYIHNLAQEAGLVENKNMLAEIASHEHPHLGNLSYATRKIRDALNQQCRGMENPVVMHGDYCGHPFGDIDFPLIFFFPDQIPSTRFFGSSFEVAKNTNELMNLLVKMERNDFHVIGYLNHRWFLRLYLARNSKLSSA